MRRGRVEDIRLLDLRRTVTFGGVQHCAIAIQPSQRSLFRKIDSRFRGGHHSSSIVDCLEINPPRVESPARFVFARVVAINGQRAIQSKL
jgi:hypothetical protein